MATAGLCLPPCACGNVRLPSFSVCSKILSVGRDAKLYLLLGRENAMISARRVVGMEQRVVPAKASPGWVGERGNAPLAAVAAPSSEMTACRPCLQSCTRLHGEGARCSAGTLGARAGASLGWRRVVAVLSSSGGR